jgi:SAM-dependent methyltransferase
MFELSSSIFHSPPYLRITQRRLEHLASLGLDLFDKSVLDVGAGIGDFSSFYLDRGCSVLAVEPREENLQGLNVNLRSSGIFLEGRLESKAGDVWALDKYDRTFDIVHAYGVLYHLADPLRALRLLKARCSGILLLETCVTNDVGGRENVVLEPVENFSQAIDGLGCRPNRAWIYEELKMMFPHVYMPLTQPSHEQFPKDWRPLYSCNTLQRSIYIASHQRLNLPTLRDELIQVHDG